MAFRQKSLKPFKVFSLRSEAVKEFGPRSSHMHLTSATVCASSMILLIIDYSGMLIEEEREVLDKKEDEEVPPPSTLNMKP